VDEDVAQAHGAFRPQITARGAATQTRTNTDGSGATIIPGGGGGIGTIASGGELNTRARTFSVVAEQSLFKGLRSINRLHEAEAGVKAAQAQLLRVEQVVLFAAASTYAGVVRDRAIQALRSDAVLAFNKRLVIVQRRFRETDVTSTDLAQARASLAEAQADQAVAAGELQVSEAAFVRAIGFKPGKLASPWVPRERLPDTLESALSRSENENPAVVQALYLEQARRHTVELIRGERYPDLALVGGYGNDAFRNEAADSRVNSLFVGLQVSVPFYDGGVIDSRVRQAKQEHVALMQDIQAIRDLARDAVRAAWGRLTAATARRRATGLRITTLRDVLQGVEREEGVGQRTLLDVLEAQRALIEAQITAVAADRDVVVNAFGVLQAVGSMTAVKLGVTDIAYDPLVHYEEVRRKPWGMSITYAPIQPQP
jgi:outer membrane protein